MVIMDTILRQRDDRLTMTKTVPIRNTGDTTMINLSKSG
jgi:hypothetical protein